MQFYLSIGHATSEEIAGARPDMLPAELELAGRFQYQLVGRPGPTGC